MCLHLLVSIPCLLVSIPYPSAPLLSFRAKQLKTRLGILVHKPELGHEADTKPAFFQQSPGPRLLYMGRHRQQNGVATFHAFLKTEFSEENLEFWLACEEFKKSRSKTKLSSKAHRIFKEFVQNEAPKEVNIDHETREITRKNLTVATTSCFDAAQVKTRTLMEKDSYPRFLKSASYQDLTVEITSKQLHT
uniref:Regulator of G-protein signaling 16 n=1 Tax=Chelonoidis abingdonii TaxID=106734 RepID=A0A8C0J264_CHEAB